MNTPIVDSTFIDSIVLLYLLSADITKADKVEALLEAGGVINVQVLNELVSVCHKKFKLNW